jgi:hypothetical protein
MKYAVEMGSCAMIYVPSFIKIGSGIQKLTGGIHRQDKDRISLLSEIRFKIFIKRLEHKDMLCLRWNTGP